MEGSKGGRKRLLGYKEKVQECVTKKKKERKRWKREIKEAKTERQIWKVVGRRRNRKKRIAQRIELGIWEEYFKELLGRVD